MLGWLIFLAIAALYVGAWLSLLVGGRDVVDEMPADRRRRDDWRDGAE